MAQVCECFEGLIALGRQWVIVEFRVIIVGGVAPHHFARNWVHTDSINVVCALHFLIAGLTVLWLYVRDPA
ncbi:hypothetical protein D3C80_2025190 [compost metagenome]